MSHISRASGRRTKALVFEARSFGVPQDDNSPSHENAKFGYPPPHLMPIDWSSSEIMAIRLSVQVALAAVAGSLPLGILLGYLMARRSFLGKSLVETILNLPLVLPPVVTGYLLLITFGRNAPVGRWLDQWLGVQLVFDWKGAALASAVMAFPLMVRAIRLAVAGVDPRLEHAARTLGAGPIDAFFTITLPLARHGVIAGAVLAFARSMGEFGATLMIAGSIPGQTQTIPLFIYDLLAAPNGMDRALRLAVVSVLISAAALFLSEYLDRRGKRPPVNAEHQLG